MLPVNAGHFLSLPSCLEGTRGLDEHSESAATLSPWKTEWQAQSLLRGAGWRPGLAVSAPQRNRIQLLLWNLILTNVFLGQRCFLLRKASDPHRSPDGGFRGTLGGWDPRSLLLGEGRGCSLAGLVYCQVIIFMKCPVTLMGWISCQGA